MLGMSNQGINGGNQERLVGNSREVSRGLRGAIIEFFGLFFGLFSSN
jgi:hypothetical protein